MKAPKVEKNKEQEHFSSISEKFKFPRSFWIVGISLAVATVVPLLIYSCKFRQHPCSSLPSDWALFGDYIGGTLNPILALIGIFVTIAIAYMSNRANKISILRREMEVRPLARISLGDYRNIIEVKIENAGLGPLIIESISVVDSLGESKNSVYDWFNNKDSDSQIRWKEYVGDVKDFVISPGKEIVLLQVNVDRNSAHNYNSRAAIRSKLASLTINLVYRDVYGNKLPTQTRSLEWFQRIIHTEKNRD